MKKLATIRRQRRKHRSSIRVAEAIEKDLKYSDKLIDTLRINSPKPPDITPRKNVRIRLCPINVCQAHPYDHDDFPASKAFASNLAAWAKITDTLYIWHYNTDFAHYLMPFPDFNQCPESIRLYRKSGVRGIFFEGAYANGGGGSDAELRSWVMAKRMWNPISTRQARTEWMTGVYGPAENRCGRGSTVAQKRRQSETTLQLLRGHQRVLPPPTRSQGR